MTEYRTLDKSQTIPVRNSVGEWQPLVIPYHVLQRRVDNGPWEDV